METTIKKFSAVFGNTYELEILSKKKVCEILDYEINQEEVLEKILEKHVNGTRTEALFNISTGKVEYHTFVGNSDLQQREHLIELYSMDGNEEEGLDVDDFLDEEEIEKAGDYPWDYIKDLNDYQERLLAAYKFHWTGFNENYIRERINELY